MKKEENKKKKKIDEKMVHHCEPVRVDPYSYDELVAMSLEEALDGLNNQQQMYSEAIAQNKNVKSALAAAGYSVNSTSQQHLLKNNNNVQRYILWLKARVLNSTFVTGADIINQWVKIAFTDITDYVEIEGKRMSFKDPEKFDGTLVKSMKVGSNGEISVELFDKPKALEVLGRYVDGMPKDYKQVIEERRLALVEQEFELKKKVLDIDTQEGQDDGLMEALRKNAIVTWEPTKKSISDD